MYAKFEWNLKIFMVIFFSMLLKIIEKIRKSLIKIFPHQMQVYKVTIALCTKVPIWRLVCKTVRIFSNHDPQFYCTTSVRTKCGVDSKKGGKCNRKQWPAWEEKHNLAWNAPSQQPCQECTESACAESGNT